MRKKDDLCLYTFVQWLQMRGYKVIYLFILLDFFLEAIKMNILVYSENGYIGLFLLPEEDKFFCDV